MSERPACGFTHDRSSCINRPGHTDSQWATNHGPWVILAPGTPSDPVTPAPPPTGAEQAALVNAPLVGASPRQPAYDAVYAYIRTLPPGGVERNAMIWRGVNAALDAVGVREGQTAPAPRIALADLTSDHLNALYDRAEGHEAQRDYLATTDPAGIAVRAIQLMQEAAAECEAIGTPHICNAVDRILAVLDKPPAAP